MYMLLNNITKDPFIFTTIHLVWILKATFLAVLREVSLAQLFLITGYA